MKFIADYYTRTKKAMLKTITAKNLQAAESKAQAFMRSHPEFVACDLNPLIANPARKKVSPAKAARTAMKKAQAWFWDGRKLTEPQELKGYVPPTSGVLVGEIVAIEYRSAKDGTTKVYRHDVTKKRELIISTDGQTLIINPAFKITKRGIEG